MQILQLSQHSVTQHLPQKNARAARQVEQIFIYPCPYPSLTTTNKTEQNLQDKEENEKNEQQEQQQIGSLICPKLIQKPNSYIVRKYYHRCVVIRKLYCIALFVSIMLSIFYYELDYSKRNDQATVLLYFSTANQIICLFFSLLSVVTENQWMTLEGTSQNSRKYGWLAITWIIILTQPYPWFESINITNFSFDLQQQIQYKLNYLLTLLSLLKWWLLIYAMIYFLKSFRIRSSKIWKKYGPSDSYMFSFKCLFKQHSILVILCLFAFLVFFFSFAYRICQRNNRSENNLFQYYGNCIWIVFITMTTVGYGDMSPVTMWGRTFGFLCTFYGVLLVSVMVLVVINTFQMDSSQAETLKIMKRLNEKKEIRIIAGEYIRLALWRLWKNKRLSKIGLYGLMQKQGRKQRNKKNLLRQLIRRSKFNDAHEKNLAVEMNRSFERVSFYVSNLSYNVDSIIGYMSEENLLDLSQMQNRSDLFKTTGFPQKKQ